MQREAAAHRSHVRPVLVEQARPDEMRMHNDAFVGDLIPSLEDADPPFDALGLFGEGDRHLRGIEGIPHVAVSAQTAKFMLSFARNRLHCVQGAVGNVIDCRSCRPAHAGVPHTINGVVEVDKLAIVRVISGPRTDEAPLNVHLLGKRVQHVPAAMAVDLIVHALEVVLSHGMETLSLTETPDVHA